MPNDLINNLNTKIESFNSNNDTNLSTLTPLSAPLTSESLKTQPSFQIPDQNITNDSATNFQNDQRTDAGIRKDQNKLLAETSKEKAATAVATDNSFDDYLDQILSAPSFSQLEATEYRRLGVDEKQLQVDKLDTQLLAEQDALRTKIENFTSKGGGLKMGVQAEIANAERESLAKQADIALLQLAAQDQLDYATRVANRNVNAQFERYEKIEQVRREVYERNKELFTTAEQREFEIKLADRNRELQAQKDQEKLVQDTKITALKMAQVNNAPQSVIDAIATARTPEDVINAGGAYGNIDLLERQIQNQQLANAVNAGRKLDYEIAQLSAAEERRKKALENGELEPEQYEEVDSIDKEFRSDPIVKEFNEAASKRYAVEEIVKNGVKGVSDMLLVYEFMKSVDPTSVVRESEFENAAKTGNIFAGQFTRYNEGYFGAGGFLPAEVQSSFLNSMNASWTGKQQQYFTVKEEFGKKVNRRFGVDNGATYLTAYEDAAPLDQATSVESAKVNQVVTANGIKYRKLADGNFQQLTD